MTWGSLITLIISVVAAVLGEFNTYIVLPIIGNIGSSIIFIANQTVLQRYLAESKPAKDTIGELLEKPDYSTKKIEYVSDAEEDLRTVLEKIPSEYLPMIIFIDDLDRCSPTKVARVIEANNLFIGGNHFRMSCLF